MHFKQSQAEEQPIVTTCFCFLGFKGKESFGLDLYGAERSSGGILCVSDVHGRLRFPSFIQIFYLTTHFVVLFVWVCFMKWVFLIIILLRNDCPKVRHTTRTSNMTDRCLCWGLSFYWGSIHILSYLWEFIIWKLCQCDSVMSFLGQCGKCK